jgi:HD-GYP domain-containing protein (c-di-GMP phosphodiesterase class II)/DNA-binding CsgD family transcriptional regulator
LADSRPGHDSGSAMLGHDDPVAVSDGPPELEPTVAGIEPFARLLSLRDEYTARHSARVAGAVEALGRRLGRSGHDLTELTLAGLLHDLGKIGVPDSILLKHGRLSDEEWSVMRCHPAWGAEVLRAARGLAGVAAIVHSHHERWDGGGYPDGRAGDDIPLSSRVVSVCDALCALTEERPYRRPLELPEAAKILLTGAGAQFESDLVDELLATVRAQPELAAPWHAGTPLPGPSARPIEPDRGERFRRVRPRAAGKPPGAAQAPIAPGIGRALLDFDTLPVLLTSRERVLALLAEPHPHGGRIADAIESDPGLTALVLRAAGRLPGNAAPVADVPTAVATVGTRALTDAVAGVEVFDVLGRQGATPVAAEQFRLHAVATRQAALEIARLTDQRAPDELAVMALLHDVGKLVLARADPGYPHDVHCGARSPEERVRAERRALGLDHAAATGVLLRRWRVHERVATGASRHHEPAGSRDATVIRLADMLAHHASGDPIQPSSMLAVAVELELSPADLRMLMFNPPSRAPGRPEQRQPSPLTRAETNILRRIADGKRYKEVAAQLGVSESTVRSHLYHVYSKLEVGDRARAVLVATDRGWI